MATCNSTLSDTHWDVDNVLGSLSLHTLGWIICGICALIATAIAMYLIVQHATHYNNPNEQRHIIRILFMIPIYAIVSWLSYVWYWHAVYWEVARDCYEAFAIAAFFNLLCHYIAPDLRSQKEFFATMEVEPWPWPLTWVNKCVKGKIRKPSSGLTWFNINWLGVFQYCFVRVAMTVVATATQATGHYCQDSLNPAFSHIWTLFFNCIAVTVAMYCLIAFYLNLKNELSPKKPFFKLLCIKLVIFFSFWQMILLDLLVSLDVIKPTRIMSPGDINVGISSLLTCVEMIIFAILHIFAFSYKPYATTAYGPAPRTSAFRSYADAFNPLDTIKAVARAFKWATIGVRQRHQQAVQVKIRKESKILSGQHHEDDEGLGLVDHAGAMGHGENVYGMGNTGGLDVHHPSPSDAMHPQSFSSPGGFPNTEYGGYSPQPVSMHPQPGLHDSPAPVDDPGDLVHSPHFGATHVDDRDYYPPPAATAIQPVPASNTLPYPSVNKMPSVRKPVPGTTMQGAAAEETPYSGYSDEPHPAGGVGLSGYQHQDLLGGGPEPGGGGHQPADNMHAWRDV